MTLRVLDLFSGIGGFSLGLERTGGFETVAFCENDPYAGKVLKKWWPAVPNFSHGIVGLNSLLRRVRTALPRVSRVRIFHSLAQAPDLPGLVRDSFGHSCEPFAWFDPESRCWRTWQRCLVEGWEIFSGTWPRSGMTRNGIAYRRPALVPLTKGTAFGLLLPTPTASQYGSNRSASSGAAVRPSLSQIAKWPTPMRADARGSSGANRIGKQVQLVDAVRMWPTPTAVDGRRGTGTYRPQDTGIPLPQAVAMAERFATPTSRDWLFRNASPETLEKNSRPLSEQIGGLLNPTWVEWLMGFPLGWTDCAVSETPSSLKSRNSSAKRSSKP
jgi:hypothetical protein